MLWRQPGYGLLLNAVREDKSICDRLLGDGRPSRGAAAMKLQSVRDMQALVASNRILTISDRAIPPDRHSHGAAAPAGRITRDDINKPGFGRTRPQYPAHNSGTKEEKCRE